LVKREGGSGEFGGEKKVVGGTKRQMEPGFREEEERVSIC